MARSDQTSAIIDGLMQVVVMSGTLSVAAITPNLLQVLDKPLQHYLRSMDARQRERELRRLTAYMLRQGLITEEYQHGIVLTSRGKKRLYKRELETNHINRPQKWDHSWRLIMFDIPADNNSARAKFTRQLRKLGLQPLQQSVWVHPYPCRDAVTLVAETYGISRYVTYIETKHIDQDQYLKQRFESVLR